MTAGKNIPRGQHLKPREAQQKLSGVNEKYKTWKAWRKKKQ